MLRIFQLHWLNGEINRIKGETIQEACITAGYGSGAVRALDYYKEIDELPYNEKCFHYTDPSGKLSEIINPIFMDQIKIQKPCIGDEVTVNFANTTFKYTLEEITKFSYRFGEQTMCFN